MIWIAAAFCLLGWLSTVTTTSNGTTLNSSEITINSVININNTLAMPIRLEINDEINIEIGPNHQSESSTTKISCCLIIDPPKCEHKQCTIRRRKICWNICTSEVMVREAPGFPKEMFPSDFIPSNWQSQPFPENLTISLPYTYNNTQPVYYPYPYPYTWCPGPYCPFSRVTK